MISRLNLHAKIHLLKKTAPFKIHCIFAIIFAIAFHIVLKAVEFMTFFNLLGNKFITTESKAAFKESKQKSKTIFF